MVIIMIPSYFNNPVDYIPGDNNPNLWKMGIILGTSEHDICKEENERLDLILQQKNIRHWLDLRPNANPRLAGMA